MKVFAALALTVLAPALLAQTPHPRMSKERPMRSRIFVYDLRDHSSHLVFTADTIWEAPNWSPDGRYLIANSGGAIYRLTFKADGTTETPTKLAIPANYQCNNDKAISPDGSKLAFSASLAPANGLASQVFLANADGSDPKRMTEEFPSFFHGWSPDNKTLAFVAWRHGEHQFDIYGMPAAGGPETQYTSNPHHDDGPDYSPDGRWIYINSDRSGKEAVWRFPSTGAGANDAKAEMVLSDEMEDWFPHISPDGKKMVYIGYPAGTPNHNPRDLHVELRMAGVDHDAVEKQHGTLVKTMGGQGTMNVNSWAPDSERFAYVTYEALP